MTKYTNLIGISELQTKIMQFVDYWVRAEKTPVPRKEIFKNMKENGSKHDAIKKALDKLVHMRYLRRAIMKPDIPLNRVYFVQLRRV